VFGDFQNPYFHDDGDVVVRSLRGYGLPFKWIHPYGREHGLPAHDDDHGRSCMLLAALFQPDDRDYNYILLLDAHDS